MITEVQSDSGSIYTIDTEELTCTCPHWKYRCRHYSKDKEGRLCKHLIGFFDLHPELKPKSLIQADKNMDRAGVDEDGKMRFPRSAFDKFVSEINSVLREFNQIIDKYEVCGSYRRLEKRVSDLDYLLVVKEGKDVNEVFNYFENVMFYEKLWRGDLKASYKILGMVQVDFKVVPIDSWAFAICHFTGSKYENIRLRNRAHQLGYSLNEYGLTDSEGNLNYFNIKTEQDIYQWLQLPYKYPWDRND